MAQGRSHARRTVLLKQLIAHCEQPLHAAYLSTGFQLKVRGFLEVA